MSGEVVIENMLCDRETDLAIHVTGGEGFDAIDGWVPKSIIHEDSDVLNKEDAGKLIIPAWKAEELGAAGAPLPRRLLPKRGEREARTAELIQSVLSIIRGKAHVLEAVGAPFASDSLCECGECDGDPVGWHRVRFAVKELNDLADQIEAAAKQPGPAGRWNK